MLINSAEVGAFSSVDPTGKLSLRFGIYLPGVTPALGFELRVRIIHQLDRFDPTVQPVDVILQHQAGSPLDLWTETSSLDPDPASHFGQEGLYLYRFQLWQTTPAAGRRLITVWSTDPFARQTDVGMLAAIPCTKTAPKPFPWTDAAWRTPALDDLIVYELHVDQFNNTFQGITDRLTYLTSLGINCLELMPVTSTNLQFDWGYGPIHYFAPDAAYGGPDALRSLIDACHASGVAVILDIVAQHTGDDFPYNRIYVDIASAGIDGIPSPMIQANVPIQFGPPVDFSQSFAQEFFQLANQAWLDDFHIDGFRYDEVTDLYNGPTGDAYALLAYNTYLYSRTIPRFSCAPMQPSRLIQCAEALSIAPIVLRETYTSCAWQEGLLGLATSIVGGALDPSTLTELAHTLDPYFSGTYPATKTVVDSANNPVEMPVAPFQYLNSHDKSHLICSAGLTGGGELPFGDRSQFFRLQPLAIALYTCQGVPMLWEGEEFTDNYELASSGPARINLRRDTNWSYFYDAQGSPLVRLYRILGQLRANNAALRSRHSFFYNQQSLQGNSVLAYHRYAPVAGTQPEQYAMVLLNFSPDSASITVPFPKAGIWNEKIDGTLSITVAADGADQTITVPSWYGAVFLL